jgi:ribosomal protein L12E/L44/L45/RPP1/RPP2
MLVYQRVHGSAMFCAGSQAKKLARAAEAARREEERTAEKRAKEEATRRQRDRSLMFAYFLMD